MSLIECSPNSNPENCAFRAGSWMIEEELIDLLPFVNKPLVVQENAAHIFDIHEKLGTDTSPELNYYLGCITCEKFVKISDTFEGTPVVHRQD